VITGETVRQHDTRTYGADPYTVPCSVCDAAVGVLCAWKLGGARNGTPHDVRVDAARELAGAQP
jgi:hypothetical protein